MWFWLSRPLVSKACRSLVLLRFQFYLNFDSSHYFSTNLRVMVAAFDLTITQMTHVELHHVGEPLCPLSWAPGQPNPHRVRVSWVRKGQKGSRGENDGFKATMAMSPVFNTPERAPWAIVWGASSWHPVKGKRFHANRDTLFREIIDQQWSLPCV